MSCFIWFLQILLDFKVHVYVTLTMGSRFLGMQILLVFAVKTVTTVAAGIARECLTSSHLLLKLPIMITKGPQLFSKTNIPLLILGWWRLCTDIKTAYACGCGNESVHMLKRVWNPQLALAGVILMANCWKNKFNFKKSTIIFTDTTAVNCCVLENGWVITAQDPCRSPKTVEQNEVLYVLGDGKNTQYIC